MYIEYSVASGPMAPANGSRSSTGLAQVAMAACVSDSEFFSQPTAITRSNSPDATL